MTYKDSIDLSDSNKRLFLNAVKNKDRVEGLTHGFYRYPARFSPQFASAAIKCFSKPGELILDPYMGGGTTVVEALATGRRIVGNDLNELGAFVTKVKTLCLSEDESREIEAWSVNISGIVNYSNDTSECQSLLNDPRTRICTLKNHASSKKASP